MGAIANPSQGHTVWMDISAKTSPGHIPATRYGQTQPEGTDHLSREASKVWMGPPCQLCQDSSVKKKGQDLAGLSPSVPGLQLYIPASWSPASSLSNSAKAAAGRKSQDGNISSSLEMPAAQHHPGSQHMPCPCPGLTPGGSICHPKPGS